MVMHLRSCQPVTTSRIFVDASTWLLVLNQMPLRFPQTRTQSKRGTLNNRTDATGKKYEIRIYSYLNESPSFGSNETDFQIKFLPIFQLNSNSCFQISPALWIWALCLISLNSASKDLPFLIPLRLEAPYSFFRKTLIPSTIMLNQ